MYIIYTDYIRFMTCVQRNFDTILPQNHQLRDFPTSACTKPISSISEPWPSLVRRTFLYQDTTRQWLDLATGTYLDVSRCTHGLLGSCLDVAFYILLYPLNSFDTSWELTYPLLLRPFVESMIFPFPQGGISPLLCLPAGVQDQSKRPR